MTSDRSIGYDAAEPPEPEGKLRCDYCGEPIFEGEAYFRLYGGKVCERCLNDNWREFA